MALVLPRGESHRLKKMSKPSRARRIAGYSLLALSVACFYVLAFLPTPYVIEEPGPVFNVLGTTASKPVITVDGVKTYPTNGNLDVLTVSVRGDRASTPSWFELAGAWLDPSKAIVPLDAVFPPTQTDSQVQAESTAMMEESQQDAIAAALTNLGYKVPLHVYVSEVMKASASAGKLVAADFILKVNGIAITDVDQLKTVIGQQAVKGALTVLVERDGKQVTQQITAVKDDKGAYRLGIMAGTKYDFPVKVNLQLGNVGGPSGGMMFALGIIDRLTPGQLTGGKNIAGTGTIDMAGNVGPIGGIRHKLYGAVRNGATIFLAPASNCDEVVGHVPAGITVVKVSKLAEAKADLENIANGTNPASFPTCTAK